MSAILARLQPVKTLLGERLWVASSCSLLHSPVDLDLEGDLSAETRSWFAFAKQKVTEVALLGRALEGMLRRFWLVIPIASQLLRVSLLTS